MKKDKEEKPKLTQKEIREKLAGLETEIFNLAKIGKAIRESNFKERAILVLLRDMTGLSMTDIKSVLDSIWMLDIKYLKKPK